MTLHELLKEEIVTKLLEEYEDLSPYLVSREAIKVYSFQEMASIDDLVRMYGIKDVQIDFKTGNCNFYGDGGFAIYSWADPKKGEMNHFKMIQLALDWDGLRVEDSK